LGKFLSTISGAALIDGPYWFCALQAAESIEYPETKIHLIRYLDSLNLAHETLWVTTDCRAFEAVIGRTIASSMGGAFLYHSRGKTNMN